jgi:hypothetical protein
LSIKKIGRDGIVKKPMTSLKQTARHRMEFLEIKSTCPSHFPKTSCRAIMNFVPNFIFTLYFLLKQKKTGGKKNKCRLNLK